MSTIATRTAIVSATSLTNALEAVRGAASEKHCAEALVSVAALLQEAVLAGQDAEALHDAIEACPNHLGTVLAAALDRAVNFTQTTDGTMGLWLVPVRLESQHELPGQVALATDNMRALKMAAAIQAQLKLTETTGRRGWCMVIPALVSDASVRSAELSTLIRLPQEARDMVRGDVEELSFLSELAQDVEAPGITLYYLPVVAFHPEGMSLDAPTPSEQMIHRLTRWVEDSFGEAVDEVEVASVPQPFSLALAAGHRMAVAGRFRSLMGRVREESGVAFNGMAALVTPYEVRNKNEDMLLGVSLMSRLTRNPLATLALPLMDELGEDEAVVVANVLRELGVECVQQHNHPVGTIACQHCGNIQFAMPNLASLDKGVHAAGTALN